MADRGNREPRDVPTRPRLLVATKSFWPSIGGAEEAARILAHAVSDEFDVTVLTVGATRKGSIARQGSINVVKTGLVAYRFSTPLSCDYVSAFRTLAGAADIVHIHSPHPLGELAVVTSRITAPIVASYHFDVVRQRLFRPFYEPVLIRALNRARLVVTSSPNVTKTSPVLSRIRSRTAVVPYGVDPAEFSLNAEETAGVSRIRSGHLRPIALFVGRLVYYKGVEYLLRAATKANVDLLVVGDGILSSELKKVAQMLGIERRVEFVPQVNREQLRLYFHACDFLVLPSIARSEFFGIVLLEAMVCGRPVITTELGTGTSWVNRDGETGLVVAPRDPDALARAMQELCSDRELARRLGEEGRRRVLSDFSQSRFVEAYAGIYRSLLAARP